MDRYCLETDLDYGHYLVHKQRCSVYHHTSLLTLDLVQDLGRFEHGDKAVQLARANYAAARPCDHCLGDNPPRN